ncbi:MAG: AMP-binding protein, partial [Chloroflexota bacterium]
MIFLLQHIIDQVAESYPDHPLFVFDENRLTYAEFVAQTNSLAHMLIDQGVKRGDRVGIHLHKSMESVIAVYGILKAGAAFVPLDPALTLSRLAYVIQDCGIRVVISQKSKLNTLNEIAKEKTGLEVVIGAQTADVDLNLRLVDWTAVNGMQSETPPSIPGLMEQDLAYIMYTSGSTGNPKGLMHTHASGLSYAKRAAELYGLHHGDILSNHSPLHFDMSTFDIYSGPLAGATTVIIPEEYKMLPASLSELIQDERI